MKILVADDEILVRIGLKTVLEGCGRGYEVIEAVDGDDALRKFREHLPALCIVDINMPAMDGMQFIEEARRIDDSALFVVLTCYSDFSFMRRGIKLEVMDYIIKTSLNNDELLALAAKAELENGTRDSDHRDHDARFAPRDSFIDSEVRNALAGRGFDTKAVSDHFARHGLEPIFSVLAISEKRTLRREGGDANALLSGIHSVVQAFIQEYGAGLIVSEEGSRFLLLLSFRSFDGVGDSRNLIEEFGARLLKSFETYFNREFVIGVYPGATVDMLGEAAGKAFEALRYAYFDKGPGLYLGGQGCSDILPEDVSNEVKLSIAGALKAAEYARIPPILDDFMLLLRSRRTSRIEAIANCLCEIFYSLKGHVKAYYPERAVEIFNENIDYAGFYATSDLATSVEALQGIAARMQGLSSESRISSYRGVVAKAKEYIDQQLGRQLSLDAVAEYLHMSPSHFSKVFKDLTGLTFISYCIECRIRKAKAYINEGNKVFVAAGMVGYNNYSYFSKLFKKVTGMTPEDYRSQIAGHGEPGLDASPGSE